MTLRYYPASLSKVYRPEKLQAPNFKITSKKFVLKQIFIPIPNLTYTMANTYDVLHVSMTNRKN